MYLTSQWGHRGCSPDFPYVTGQQKAGEGTCFLPRLTETFSNCTAFCEVSSNHLLQNQVSDDMICHFFAGSHFGQGLHQCRFGGDGSGQDSISPQHVQKNIHRAAPSSATAPVSRDLPTGDYYSFISPWQNCGPEHPACAFWTPPWKGKPHSSASYRWGSYTRSEGLKELR